ncbi:MAG: beta-N-acetylglucosaminidase domain-containing protein [Myxococcales bacterium]|nr:beta-N-acetylglucosaminidase domain-containing protein [Myxococcales bacterium]
MRAPREGVGFGVVEGFYGRPWSFEARTDLVRLLGESGLTTYLYAPKSDPEHRARWWEPLGQPSLEAFRELGRVADAAGVRLVYGIAPERLFGTKNLRVRKERDLEGDAFRALVKRLASLVDCGIREIALLFDDTWPTVLPRLASFEKGRAHALIATRLASALGVEVAVVPAVYFGRAADLSRGALEYLRGLASQGPLLSAWTGARIFSSYVSVADLDAVERATGLRLWLWNNAIANDWLPLATGEVVGGRGRERLCYGPVDNLAPELFERGNGVLLNGSREVVTTRIALATFAELRRNGRGYRADEALDRALRRLFGGACEPVARLLGLVFGHALASPHAANVSAIDDLAGLARRGDAKAVRAIEEALEPYLAVDGDIEKALAGHPALDELRPTALKAARSARALLASLKREPGAPRLAADALRIPWGTALDGAVLLAQKGRFV